MTSIRGAEVASVRDRSRRHARRLRVLGTMKAEVDDTAVKDVMAGRQPLRKLLGEEQRAFFSAYAPDGVTFDDLSVLGPINVLKLKFTPEGYGRRMVAELWLYPDGSRILELSTKCEPTEAFDVAAETSRLPQRP